MILDQFRAARIGLTQSGVTVHKLRVECDNKMHTFSIDLDRVMIQFEVKLAFCIEGTAQNGDAIINGIIWIERHLLLCSLSLCVVKTGKLLFFQNSTCFLSQFFF